MPDNTTDYPPSKRPFGRTLSDLWLDGEEGKLHPAEWHLLDCAARGEWCKLGTNRPTLANDENRIRAELLRFVALGGDHENPLHEHGTQLHAAFVECANGKFDLSGAKMEQNFGLLHSTVQGRFFFQDSIAKTVNLGGTEVDSLWADRATVSGSLFLRNGFRAKGEVRLLGAKIGSDLDCSGGQFDDPIISLHCDGIETSGKLSLFNGFRAAGTVRLHGARIMGTLDCRNGRFLHPEIAIDAQGATVQQIAFFDDGFFAVGMVDLSAMFIGTHLFFSSATFSCKDKSIHAPRATIGGSVYLGSECRVAGQVSFQGASIGGDITFAGGSFEGKPAISLKNANIGGTLIWRGVEYAKGELNLAGASCLTLNMDWSSWEQPEQIRLDSFTYKGFSELPKGCDAQFWKSWLERQPENHLKEKFRPNPYSQLAEVLQRMGHEQEAVSVLVEQRRRQSDFTRLYEPVADNDTGQLIRRLVIFWNFMQGLVVDYGYRPGKALLYLFGIVVMGAIIYQLAAFNGIMSPTHPLIFKEAGLSIPVRCARNWIYPGSLAKDPAVGEALADECEAKLPSEYSTFNAFIYSADVALPIVNFRMETDWSPRVVDWKTGEAPGFLNMPPWGWGWWVRTWEWVQIALGWLLSLLFASAIGGIIRR